MTKIKAQLKVEAPEAVLPCVPVEEKTPWTPLVVLIVVILAIGIIIGYLIGMWRLKAKATPH